MANKEYNTFVKGLITEANPLTYPESASIDEENFYLFRDGSRQRRLGMDYEVDYTLQPSSDLSLSFVQQSAISTHLWKNAANNGLYNFVVVQIGYDLYIHEASQGSLSSAVKARIYLASFQTNNYSSIEKFAITVSSGKGYLFVVGQHIKPFYISYDPASDTFSAQSYDIYIRDFLGLDDGLAINQRPDTLSPEHKYNLVNQGWSTSQIETFYSNAGVYPSNADVYQLGKKVNPQSGNEEWSWPQYSTNNLGNTPAPKGRVILNAFDQDRAEVTGITGLVKYGDRSRPTAVSFYAGRVFYSGVKSERYYTGYKSNAGHVYFSQVITDIGKAGLCYQEADPTSEAISDLIATDGGVITIPEAGEILRIVSLLDVLVVIATNGIWEIGGKDGSFDATSYYVNKITDDGAVSNGTIVEAEGSLAYWSEAGIYLVKSNERGKLTAENISQTTIQTLYVSIPADKKKYARGIFDRTDRKFRWMYGSERCSYTYSYDTELVLDMVLGAFYKYTVTFKASNSPYLAGYVQTPRLVNVSVNYNVVDGAGNTVQDAALNDIVYTELSSGSKDVSIKYLIMVPNAAGGVRYTFGLYRNKSFLDWGTEDYVSYVVTGYDIYQDTMRSKNLVYLVTSFKRTEDGFYTDASGNLQINNPSSCMVEVRWDWADHINSGKYTTPFQAYRLQRNYIPSGSADKFNYGHTVIQTKNRVRGSGKAISFKFSSEKGKNLHLLGWAVSVSGTPNV